MSNSVNALKDKVSGYFTFGLDAVRKKILGNNNERLDFLMDSFYKLPPKHQTGVLLGAIGGLGLFVLGAVGIYFARIHALEDELNASFLALQELRTLSNDYDMEKTNMDTLLRDVETKMSSVHPKPFFEQKANQVGVTIEGLRSEDADIPPESPLAKNFKYINVDFRMPKVSIPRMLKFLGEIERADKNFTINQLQIRARYGDRLYFDTQAKVVAYKVGGQN